ncbi:hypothetical protein KI387_012400, partial [Taxus chinensis]
MKKKGPKKYSDNGSDDNYEDSTSGKELDDVNLNDSDDRQKGRKKAAIPRGRRNPGILEKIGKRRAIVKSYEKTDKAILGNTPKLGLGSSTVVTAILIDGKKLLVVNVGDSRAVLCRNGRAIQLSVDHELGVSTEHGSIKTRGGFISNMPDPNVREVDIDSGTEFLILASDGLWKMMLLLARKRGTSIPMVLLLIEAVILIHLIVNNLDLNLLQRFGGYYPKLVDHKKSESEKDKYGLCMVGKENLRHDLCGKTFIQLEWFMRERKGALNIVSQGWMLNPHSREEIARPDDVMWGTLSSKKHSRIPEMGFQPSRNGFDDSQRNALVCLGIRVTEEENPKKQVLGFFRFDRSSADILQASFPSSDKGPSTNSNDIMKLFNDAQQNILYLNKQRLVALEELKSVRREKELLLARLGQLEAESQSSTAECDVLKQKLSLMETAAVAGGAWDLQKSKKKSGVKVDPPSIFSEILLRIDSMVLVGAISTAQASEMRSLVVNKNPVLAETFYNIKHMSEKEMASGLLPLLDLKRRQALHIVQICTEMAPITDAGIVASYVTDLCRTLRRRNYLVEVILPKYKCMDLSHVQGFQEVEAEFYAYFGGEWHRNKIWTGTVYGIAVTFIEPFHPGDFFAREHLYGYEDDFERFTYFCRASLEYLVKSGKQPDILHLHNWHTASVAPLFWDIFVHQGLGSTRILFTCHDFEYQCVQQPKKLGLCGLDPEQLHRPDRLQDNLEPRLVNLLKGGIVYSNKVVMISTPCANSIMMKKESHGLESTLTIHKNKIISVPYGLDDTIWNPATDKFLPATFSAEDLTGKDICRTALRRCVGLFEPQATTAIVGCVCLDMSDAELEFTKSALTSALRNGAQFVLMGASKSPRIQAGLEKLQKNFK